jgi:hypothetical protein
MRLSTTLTLAAGVSLLALSSAWADMQGTGQSGGWAKRIAVVPDPSKVVVPKGYEVSVFVAGLDTPSSATVDKDGNLWVAISGKLLGAPTRSTHRTSRSSTRPASSSRRSAKAPSRR